jgi:hypothetical protein
MVDIQIKPTLLVEQHIAQKQSYPSAAEEIIFKRHHSKLAQK